MQPRHNIIQWRQNNSCFYDFMYENSLDWPVTSVQWGPLIQQTTQFIVQRLYFSCKTDGIFNANEGTWANTPNYIVMATLQIPKETHYFLPDLKALFNFDATKKHPNLWIKQVISHPGEITVIRSSPMNRKLLASKSDNNMVYIWTSQKYKVNGGTNSPNSPDMILMTTVSSKHNYALRFTPSLPRIISASQNKLQLFDIDNISTKRELGSVLQSNLVKPLTVLQGHDGVEDIAFKNNQICVSGGQDKEIGIWDLRVSCLCHKIKDIHEGDINAVACKGSYILSGGEEGRLNIIDERKYEVVESYQMEQSIHSLQFNPVSNHFGMGRSHLEIYNLTDILATQEIKPIFTHLGMKGNINEFDWNTEAPMALATTFQDIESDLSTQGGFIHIFRPIDIFFMDRDQAEKAVSQAYEKMDGTEKAKLRKNMQEEAEK